VDERRDPARSTQAAIKFLSDLHERFGNWELAMGAYNMGYAGMSRAIAKYNSNDYWTLSRLESGIPWETSLYVPKIVALAIVMNNREAFGLGRIQSDPQVSFDTVLVEPAVPLAEVAKASQVKESVIRRLNPQLIAFRTPPVEEGKNHRFAVRVPQGKGKSTAQALQSTFAKGVKVAQLKWGENIADLAARYGTSSRRVRSKNRLGVREEPVAGTVLLLPSGAKESAIPLSSGVVVTSRRIVPGPGQKRVFYRVRKGDDLQEVAEVFGVRAREIARWNALNPSAHLRANMSLAILVPEDRVLEQVRYISADRAQVLLAGSSEFHEYFEGLKGKNRFVVRVKKGDSLRKIGKRYGMSVGSMERVNRRSRRTKLIVGEQLVVYTEKVPPLDATAPVNQPLPELRPAHPELLPQVAGSAKH
ncbi:MAG: LysM peptidoglycan-binding domain-containing protein, partial [Polyangiaceae bacterium]|nr:LysM peptidoglycan-binding domain-containing protein [Polyangiaceae bacterium]